MRTTTTEKRLHALERSAGAWRLGAIGTGLGLALLSWSADADLPDDTEASFATGDTIRAANINALFNASFDAINALEADSTPAGVVVAFAGESPPDGWLVCDGSEVSRREYAALFHVLGVAHGLGDGVSTFNIPDYRGRFIRGVDSGAGRDPDAASRQAPSAGGNEGDAVGSVQNNALGEHVHAVDDPGHAHELPGSFGWGNWEFGGNNWAAQVQENGQSSDVTPTGIEIEPSGASETRPVNSAVLFIVKI